jgi:hypothetical protein
VELPDNSLRSLNLIDVVAQHKKRLAQQKIDPNALISPLRWQNLNNKPVISGSYKVNVILDEGDTIFAPTFEWDVRIDVDGWYPQNWISVHIGSIFGPVASAIFKLSLMSTPTPKSIRLEAALIHSFGNQDLLTFDALIFEASQGGAGLYKDYVITLSHKGFFERALELERVGSHFDKLSIEIDNLLVQPASEFRAPVTTSLDTKEHDGNLPSLPKEILTLPKIFGRAGFNTKVSINPKAEITDLAGDDKLWSDSELHNAMINYWSQNADFPQWSVWSVFADTHETGRDLLGVMFDVVGNTQRQGCAVFLDSYISALPLEDFVKHIDEGPTARRRVFWTLIHELGHILNLGHSFEKSDGVPWIDMANDAEALSFMNYPEYVTGSVKSFFAKFGWRFGDDELKFLRHAPRQFVQPGYADWNDNHGAVTAKGRTDQDLGLHITSDRGRRHLEFMEPLWLEITLSNSGKRPIKLDRHCLEPSHGLTIRIRRKGGPARIFKPMVQRCVMPASEMINAGSSRSHRQFMSADASGWLIDEPGLYEVQAMCEINGRLLRSNTLQLYVAAPTGADMERLAADYFVRDVGAVLAFDGAPALVHANAVLEDVVGSLPQSAAAIAAAIAISGPKMTRYKTISFGSRGLSLTVSTSDDADRSRSRLRRMLSAHGDTPHLLKRIKSSHMAAQFERLLAD